MSALIVALNNLVQKRFVCRLDEFGAFIAKTESITETVVFHTIEDCPHTQSMDETSQVYLSLLNTFWDKVRRLHWEAVI